MKTLCKAALILMLSGLAISQAGFIQTAFALADVRSEAMVDKAVITLGDLLDNLENGQNIRVMDAPAPGEKVMISTRYLAALTRQHDVYWQNSRRVQHIAVTRQGQSIRYEKLKALILPELEALNRQRGKQDLQFDHKNGALHLPTTADMDDIHLEKLDFNHKNGRFSAHLSYPQKQTIRQTEIVTGRSHMVLSVPALNKRILPGKTITAQDIMWVPLLASRVDRHILRQKNQLIGMTPKRSLRSGTALRHSDLKRPQIINRGTVVSIVYQAGKINLTATGKAIEGGGRGDVIRVMNSKSHKSFDAVIIGPNQVRVTANQGDFAQLTLQ